MVELLAALVAGGLLLALLGAMTGQFGSELRRSTAGDGFDQIAAASTLLDRLLQGAEAKQFGAAPVEADAAHLTTYVDPPLARRGSGLMRLELAVVRNADGDALELTLAEAEGGAIVDHRTLIRGMRAIDLELERDEQAAASRPPRLITIAFTTPADQVWDLAVEPRLTGTGGCRFDPISMTCRT